MRGIKKLSLGIVAVAMSALALASTGARADGCVCTIAYTSPTDGDTVMNTQVADVYNTVAPAELKYRNSTVSGTSTDAVSISVSIAGTDEITSLFNQTIPTTPNADGSWSVQPSTMSRGNYKFTATATDASGGTASETIFVVVIA